MKCPTVLPVVSSLGTGHSEIGHRAYMGRCKRFPELHCCRLQTSELILSNPACSCGAVLLVTTAWRVL